MHGVLAAGAVILLVCGIVVVAIKTTNVRGKQNENLDLDNSRDDSSYDTDDDR